MSHDPTRLEVTNALNFCLWTGLLPKNLDYKIARNESGRWGVLYWVDDPLEPTKIPNPIWVDPRELLSVAKLKQELGGRRVDF